ncbi:MAG: hypothetical protein KGJ13_09020 [Patescibacteria group bacterium]|nr:hypothetical protein [Patescibacteria group bacterium]
METATERQIRFAEFLSKSQSQVKLPSDYRSDKRSCGKFIDQASYWYNVTKFPTDLQQDIYRIWRGELKNDPCDLW